MAFLCFVAVFTDATSVFGCVEICVNTAGILNEENWRHTLQVNLVSAELTIQLLIY